jgi:hypothetical protein
MNPDVKVCDGRAGQAHRFSCSASEADPHGFQMICSASSIQSLMLASIERRTRQMSQTLIASADGNAGRMNESRFL